MASVTMGRAIAALSTSFALWMLGCAARSGEPMATPAEPAWQSSLGLDHPLVGRIVEGATGRTVGQGELLRALAGVPVVVLGEKHDNPDHHRLQAAVIDKLAARGHKPSVVLEMIELAQQPAVDAALAASPHDPDALARALDWPRSGWPAFALYRPVFESALEHGLPIRAGSLDRDRVMDVGRRGLEALSPPFADTYGLGAPSLDAAPDALRAEMREAHCSMLPESMLDAMVLVQRARDATLADSVYAAAQRSGSAVLIAGNGHARIDRGVPRYLARAHGLASRALAFVEVKANLVQAQAYARDDATGVVLYDYVWFTPRANDDDPCEGLRKR